MSRVDKSALVRVFRQAAAGWLLSLAVVSPSGAQWTPAQPVEIVVGFSPGGGSDRSARKLNRILQETGLLQNAVVVNKPGASGSIGWNYMKHHTGNGHYINIATPTLLTSYIAGRSAFSHTDVTPLARLYSESAVFAVRTESQIRDWRDLAERLKNDPAAVSLGSGNREGAAPLAFAAAMKAAGADPRKMKLVIFNSAGDAVTASLGGHVEVAVVTAGGVKQHLANGTMRALAVSTAQRIASGPFATAPTLTEQGVNVVAGGWRVVMGTKSLAGGEVAFWDGVFSRMAATQQWKQELGATDAANEYLNSADTTRFVASQYEQLRELMTELGLAKK
ncbi:MAG: hypothetical protein A3H35_01925 [Betaproteobacteria bacterium RIFCSPLOWO2_02_FULL_62_17]|nr:MAG: hypothetical protein A3H35_01925 [Betaproteobacteria bacterium RIFCSPLOWO2_02_FULL_62_17]